jgi:1,4-alpha-glucan branching enzyme
MWAHPGKKLMFMGSELAQPYEWRHDESLPWHLLQAPDHAGVHALIGDLNRVYRSEPALWELDSDPRGFWWIEPNDVENNVFVFVRSDGAGRLLVCAVNFSPVPRHGYRIGLPRGGDWREALNTDSVHYGGSNVGNLGGVSAEPVSWHGQAVSAALSLPPLATIWLVPERPR